MVNTLRKEFSKFLRDYFSERKDKIVNDETMVSDWKIGHKEVRDLLKRMVLALALESDAYDREKISDEGEAALSPILLGFAEIGEDSKGRHLYVSFDTLKNLLRRVFSKLPTLLNENETYQAFQELTGEKEIDPGRLKKAISTYTPLIRFFENDRGGAATLNLYRFFYPEREAFVSKTLLETTALKTSFLREEKRGLFSKKEQSGAIDPKGIIETAFALTFSEIGRLIIPLQELYAQKAFRSYFEEDRLPSFIEKELPSFYAHQPTIKKGVLNLFPENWIDVDSVERELKQKMAEGADPNGWLKQRYPFLNRSEITTLIGLFASPSSSFSPARVSKPELSEKASAAGAKVPVALPKLQQKNTVAEDQGKEKSGSTSVAASDTEPIQTQVPSFGIEKTAQIAEVERPGPPVSTSKPEGVRDADGRSAGARDEGIGDLIRHLAITDGIVPEKEPKSEAPPQSQRRAENRVEMPKIGDRFPDGREQIEEAPPGPPVDVRFRPEESKASQKSQSVDALPLESTVDSPSLFNVEPDIEALEIVREPQTEDDHTRKIDFESLESDIDAIDRTDFVADNDREEVEYDPGSGEAESLPEEDSPFAIPFETNLVPPLDFSVAELPEDEAEKTKKVSAEEKSLSGHPPKETEETPASLQGKIITVLTDNEELNAKIGLLSGMTGFELRDSLAYWSDIAVFDRDFEYLIPIAKNTGMKIYLMRDFLRLLGLS